MPYYRLRHRRSGDGSTTDVATRINLLRQRDKRIGDLTKSVQQQISKLKSRLKYARGGLVSKMKVGMQFNQESTLQVRNPDDLEQLALETQVSFYANVSRLGRGDDRAFLFYMGNVIDTHTKMPRASTDDYMALEIVEGGRAKLTMDMGAGQSELLSNEAITYDQWIFIDVQRRAHEVTLSVSTEVGPGVIDVDQARMLLPRYDDSRRPFGSVFNLHKDLSRIYVGGFPRSVDIQDSVRESFMVGQIEGLSIGGKEVGLYNFVTATGFQAASGRNKFKKSPKKGRRFNGNGYLALDRNDYLDMTNEYSIKMRFKPSGTSGLLFLAGDVSQGSFVALELRNQYLVYSFNLGSGASSLTSSEAYDLNTWHSVEISRDGRSGSISVNNEELRDIEYTGQETTLAVSTDLYVGGYPGSEIPFYDVQAFNFSGCVEDVFIGPDSADLNRFAEAVNTVQGCEIEVNTHIPFPRLPHYLINSLSSSKKKEEKNSKIMKKSNIIINIIEQEENLNRRKLLLRFIISIADKLIVGTHQRSIISSGQTIKSPRLLYTSTYHISNTIWLDFKLIHVNDQLQTKS